jgi:hypothetical protein
MSWSVDRRTFSEQTKAYFGHTDPSRYVARSWIRLLISSLLLVGISVGLVLLGSPDFAFILLLSLVVGVVRLVYSILRPMQFKSPYEPGWRMDPLGNFRWWNGSAFTDAPPDETPRKVGPEIEW